MLIDVMIVCDDRCIKTKIRMIKFIKEVIKQVLAASIFGQLF